MNLLHLTAPALREIFVPPIVYILVVPEKVATVLVFNQTQKKLNHCFN